MRSISPSGKDPHSTSASPPGGINAQINVSVTGQDIIFGILLMMYIVCDGAGQARHLAGVIITSYLLPYVVNNNLLWLLLTT